MTAIELLFLLQRIVNLVEWNLPIMVKVGDEFIPITSAFFLEFGVTKGT